MKQVGIVLAIVLWVTSAAAQVSNALYKEGVRLGNEGKVDEAVGKFQKAVAFEPGNFLYQLKLAYAYDMTSRLPEAHAAYEAALTLKSNSPEANRGLADVLRRLRFFVPAEKAYEKALSLKRNYEEALMGLGILYAEQDQLDKAAGAYLKVCKMNSKNVDAAFKAANVFWREKKYPEAVEYYRKALTLKPDLHDARFGLGLALKEKGDIEGAKVELRKACDAGVKQACKRLLQQM